jgi:predicted Zn-dependent peptidase
MIKIKELDCGIRIVMEEITHVQSVSIGIWVKTGAVDEDSSIAGISHYIEHMLFKGTKDRNAKQIAEDVDKIGGQINAFTGKESTCYYIKTLTSNTEKAVNILLDMFLNSKFENKELIKEKQVILEEIKMIQDSPEDDVHDIICELIFKGHRLENSIIGTPKSLKGISRQTILKYLEEEYTRDNVVISVSGNFNEKTISELFENKLIALKKSKGPKGKKYLEYKPIYKVKVKDIEQTHICLGTRTFGIIDDRQYALTLLNNIMGGSMSSRLFQNIREEKGLAYSVYSMANSFEKEGYYNIYAGSSHDKIEDVILAIKEELLSLKENGISEDELSIAKEQLKSTYIFSQENVNGRMFSIGKSTILLDKVYTSEEIIQGIDKVTMSDIKDVSELIYDIKNYCGVAITNKKINLKKIILS